MERILFCSPRAPQRAQQWDISQWSFIQIRVITRIAESIKTVNNAYKMQNKDR